MMKKNLSIGFQTKLLLPIYKSFVRPNLDYADIIYDKPHKGSFIKKIERVQHSTCLAITGAFKGN